MKVVLIDLNWKHLLPLTFSKSVSELLVGIDTIGEKWTRQFGQEPLMLTAKYLQDGYNWSDKEELTLINASVIPTDSLAEAIEQLKNNQFLTYRGKFVAGKIVEIDSEKLSKDLEMGNSLSLLWAGSEEIFYNDECLIIEKPSDIFTYNDAILRQDFDGITKGFRTTDFPRDVLPKGGDIFIEDGANLNHCVLNASTGPIYIGKDAEVMEGSLIRGPFSLGANSTLKMGAKIYGATSIGRHCKVGGEVNNCIVSDFSNKGHDGFLGNSVIGSWCNIGADTNTSNLKNNYGEVSVWSYPEEKIVKKGMQFHGLVMGDHSKAGINTMFNTGTTLGMCCNIFDSGFPPKFLPSFSWGSAQKGFEDFKMEKAIEAATAMMERRKKSWTKRDEKIFEFVNKHDAKFRKP